MTLPVGLPTVVVSTGPHTDCSGVPYTGTAAVKPSTPVVWAATGQVLHDGEIEFSLDAAGAAAITLPANDADGLTRTGFTYTFRFNFTSSAGEKAEILPLIVGLPQAAPTVDLDILTTVTSTTGVPIGLPAVVSVAGLSGVVTVSALQAAISSTPTSRTITAGTGLTGGGDLTANRTLALTSGAQASLALADTAVQPARQVIAGTGLTGGGTLAADRTLTVTYGTTTGTACAGNDARLSDTRVPTDGTVTTAKLAAGLVIDGGVL